MCDDVRKSADKRRMNRPPNSLLDASVGWGERNKKRPSCHGGGEF